MSSLLYSRYYAWLHSDCGNVVQLQHQLWIASVLRYELFGQRMCCITSYYSRNAYRLLAHLMIHCLLVLLLQWWAKIAQTVLEFLVDYQWSHFLSKQVPNSYMTEMKGFGDGASTVGVKHGDKLMSRVVVLANMPGSLSDIKYVIADELKPHDKQIVEDMLHVVGISLDEVMIFTLLLLC